MGEGGRGGRRHSGKRDGTQKAQGHVDELVMARQVHHQAAAYRPREACHQGSDPDRALLLCGEGRQQLFNEGLERVQDAHLRGGAAAGGGVGRWDVAGGELLVEPPVGSSWLEGAGGEPLAGYR